MIVAVGFVLLSAALVAFWFAGSDTRSGDYAMSPMWAIRFGKTIAVVGGMIQLILSGILLGAATGPVLICVAWMIAGCIYTACVNGWPYWSLRCAWFLGLAGLLLVIFRY